MTNKQIDRGIERAKEAGLILGRDFSHQMIQILDAMKKPEKSGKPTGQLCMWYDYGEDGFGLKPFSKEEIIEELNNSVSPGVATHKWWVRKDKPIREVYEKWKRSFNIHDYNFLLKNSVALDMWNAIKQHCEEEDDTL